MIWSVPVISVAATAPAFAASFTNTYTAPGTYAVTIPAGYRSIAFVVEGAGGGGSAAYSGGDGGRITGTITLANNTTGTTLTVVVGGGGGEGNGTAQTAGAAGTGYGAGGGGGRGPASSRVAVAVAARSCSPVDRSSLRAAVGARVRSALRTTTRAPRVSVAPR